MTGRYPLLGMLAALAVLTCSPAPAVMPPDAEAQAAFGRIETAARLRQTASDVTRIEIGKINMQEEAGNGCPANQQWQVTAKVMATSRGTLKPGESITLRYETQTYTCPGPIHEHMPRLATGMATEAFLNCQGGECHPAADTMSFMSDADFSREQAQRRDEVQRHVRPVDVPDPALRGMNTVYFGADRIALTSDEQKLVIEAHAAFLRSHQNAYVVLIGHGEQRSTREHAVAVGQKRADAVRTLLIAMGVNAKQIETISHGKEDPLPATKAKKPGARNGRVEIVYSPIL